MFGKKDPRIQEFEADGSQQSGMVKRLCKEEEVGYVDLWDRFVVKEELYARDGLHLSGRGLQCLPRDCQGQLPVAWVWAGGFVKEDTKSTSG